MIIKTRLAFDSPLYRLSALVNDCCFQTLLIDIVDQWNLPKNEPYSLLWKGKESRQGDLIIEKEKEWQLFCRLHPADHDEIVELRLISSSSLAKLLPIELRTEKEKASKSDAAPLQEPKPNETIAAPKYAFHSVEPQPLKKRQTYAERVQKESAQQKMQAEEIPAAPIDVAEDSSHVEEGQQEEPMSAYDRVMARSRMQGEGLNQFFGTVMARRAGHSTEKADEPAPEAVAAAPNIVEQDNATAEAANEDDAVPTPPRQARSKEEITGTNTFLENAWQEKLKAMGHGSNGGSPYARLRVGKGKQRQDGDAPEASTSQSQRKLHGVSHSEEALEALGPLQGTFTATSPVSLPSSRPGSSSGLSFSGTSAKTSISRFLKKGQYSKRRLFASQPSSLHESESVTPSGSEAFKAKRRQRSISFRSLSDALSREKRSEKRSSILERHIYTTTAASGPQEEQGEHFKQNAKTKDTIVELPREDAEARPAIPSKEHDREVVRPTLLRASQSAPLSSTAVNLSPVGGITLHISSIGQPVFAQHEVEHQEDQGISKSNLFDLMLPREIRLKCFKWLIRLYDEDEDSSLDESAGKERAVRELMRLSRVSKTWQSLLLDGQLWTTVDSSLLSNVSNGALLRLARSAGPFIKTLDLHQAPRISSSLLVAMVSSQFERTEEAARFKSMMSVPSLANPRMIRLSSLTRLNLKGCRQINTKSLHSVVVRLPSLLHINISNMDSVTNDTCLLLGSCCPTLLSLDISRCINTSGKGIVQFIQAAQGALYDKALFSPTMQVLERQEDIALPLKELRAAACSNVDDQVMALIGNMLRSLQVLDLSYCADLTDDMISSLVAHPGPAESTLKTTKTTYQLAASHGSSIFGPYITLTPRQAGGDIQSDEAHHRHLLGSLQHICLSSCRKLTDRACIYLAYAVPNLQYLELANIGAGLRNEGLVALFKTTPLIQRVDLEGANEVTEIVLETITPDVAYVQSIGLERGWNSGKRRSVKKSSHEASPEELSAAAIRRQRRQRPPPPGAWLTHLVLSSVLKADADCLLDLVRRCPRLTHLQLDDTKATDSILKEFVALCRLREVKGGYLSLIDCRALSRSINSDVLSQAAVRPREGRRGKQFQPLDYSIGNTAAGASSHQHQAAINEYDDRLIVVKTFFNWEIRSQQRRTQRRNQRAATMAAGSVTNRFLTRARRDSIGAALSFMGGNQDEVGEGLGRWNRLTGGLLGQGDEADDARGCSIM